MSLTNLPTVEVPYDNRQTAGTWWIDPSSPIIRMSCPNCGCKADLFHSIDNKGNVSPSLKCPGQTERLMLDRSNYSTGIRKVAAVPSCGFHANVVLLEWPETWSVKL